MKYLIIAFCSFGLYAQNPVIAYPLTTQDVGANTPQAKILPPEKPMVPVARIAAPSPVQATTRAEDRAATEARAALESNVKTDEYTPIV